jgi:fluoride exporter
VGTSILVVALGGAAGSVARFLVATWAARALGTAFPYGTMIVNVVGSFLIGFIMHVSLTTTLISPTLRLALTTGVMGGFTTYSTFNYETMSLLEQGAFALAGLNLGGTVVGCLIGGLLGLIGGRLLVGG